MFEILMECSVNPTEVVVSIICYKAAIVAWEKFKSGKCD